MKGRKGGRDLHYLCSDGIMGLFSTCHLIFGVALQASYCHLRTCCSEVLWDFLTDMQPGKGDLTTRIGFFLEKKLSSF